MIVCICLTCGHVCREYFYFIKLMWEEYSYYVQHHSLDWGPYLANNQETEGKQKGSTQTSKHVSKHVCIYVPLLLTIDMM